MYILVTSYLVTSNHYYAIDPHTAAIFSFADTVNAVIPENVSFFDNSPLPRILTESFFPAYPRITNCSVVIVEPFSTRTSLSSDPTFTAWNLFTNLKCLLKPLNLGNLCTNGVCPPSKLGCTEAPALAPSPLLPLPEVLPLPEESPLPL